MYHRIDSAWALRGWLRAPHVLYHLESGRMCHLSRESFELLRKCDGQTELQGGEVLRSFVKRGMVAPCAQGEQLDEEQRYRFYWNHHFRAVEWSITNRCNYRCKHCFVTRDARPVYDESSYERCLSVIDQLVGAGIHEVWLTGGEPLLHPRFLDIAHAIVQSGLRLTRIMTNGSLITDELLDALDGLNIRPIYSVSFDGLNAHDWMRGVPGAEAQTLGAIERLKARGLEVRVHMCVHRGNVSVVKDSLMHLSALNVDLFRVIRTAEAPRWRESAMDQTLSPEEYYEAAIDLFKWYRERGIKAPLWVWGVGYADQTARKVTEAPLTDDDIADVPICPCARAMFFLSGDGSVGVCNQLSGVMREKGDDWGNLGRSTLREILGDSPLMDRLLYTVGDFLRDNPGCANCRWRHLCRGGCRAFPYGLKDNFFGPDETKCVFYRGGYYERLRDVLDPGRLSE